MTTANSPIFLVADVGGTNTRVAMTRGTVLMEDSVERFKNDQFDGLETVLEAYVTSRSVGSLDGACVAVAGPVHDGQAELTNRAWKIDSATVARPTGSALVSVINDLEAQGHALDHTPADQINWIIKPSKPASAPDRLVIGVGTGFNCAPVHDTATGRIVAAAEAGHAGLPVSHPDDLDLALYIAERHGFASIEEALSGRGLETIYAWRASRQGGKRALDAAGIMAACRDQSDPHAVATVKTFVRLFGAVVGDLALITLPFGGLFLVGGVTRAVAPYLEEFGFSQAFLGKGRFSEFLSDFSVAVVEDDFAALLGCAASLNAKFLRNSS